MTTLPAALIDSYAYLSECFSMKPFHLNGTPVCFDQSQVVIQNVINVIVNSGRYMILPGLPHLLLLAVFGGHSGRSIVRD